MKLMKELICDVKSFQGLTMVNCTIKTSSLLSVFPTGDYKLVNTISDGINELGQFKFVFSILSSNRDTFG